MNDARLPPGGRIATRWILLAFLLALMVAVLLIFGPMVYGGING